MSHRKEIMLTVFWNSQVINKIDFFDKGQFINREIIC
jgi:hypothetical protein